MMQLYAGFRDHYNLEILFINDNDQDDTIFFSISTIFGIIGKKFSFGDALVALALSAFNIQQVVIRRDWF